MPSLNYRCLILLPLLALLGACQGRLILSETRQNQVLAEAAPVKIWFVKTVEGEPRLWAVQRKLSGDKIAAALRELLSGPLPEESKHGLGSEIPGGTVLLAVERTPGAVEVNLSRRFAGGGGITSIGMRLKQIQRTLNGIESSRNIYLNVEGKRLSLLGGEGVEVKQPINK